jgi:alkanesulfonate monooxygenase SsuD/methylene tetrahydromethanopterin reductase-like flavin-dependent oxidoreductase (luciferase family)
MELAGVRHSLACSAVGSPDTVRAALESIIAQTQADELILTAQIYDHAARLRSFEIGAHLHEAMTAAAGT